MKAAKKKVKPKRFDAGKVGNKNACKETSKVNRSVVVSFRVTPDRYESYQRRAKQQKMTVRDWVKYQCG